MLLSRLLRQLMKVKVQVATLGPNYFCMAGILTYPNLRIMRVCINARCLICDQCNENTLHALFDCDTPRSVWSLCSGKPAILENRQVGIVDVALYVPSLRLFCHCLVYTVQSKLDCFLIHLPLPWSDLGFCPEACKGFQRHHNSYNSAGRLPSHTLVFPPT